MNWRIDMAYEEAVYLANKN